jgi:LysM repeat protein
MRSRLAILVGLPVLSALVVSCGSSGSSSGPSTTTARVTESTLYVTLPITSSTTTTTPLQGQVVGQQTYKVLSGDVPVNVAKKFNVTLEALNAANAATPNYSAFYVGLEIIIPATTVDVNTPPVASETTLPAGSTATTPGTAGSTDTDPPASGGCTTGTYTIVEGDVPIRVAEKLGTTVDALNAANAGTSGYSSFYVGLKINVPAKEGC